MIDLSFRKCASQSSFFMKTCQGVRFSLKDLAFKKKKPALTAGGKNSETA